MAEAQQVPPPKGAVIKPSVQLEIPPPQVRTWKEMKAAAALEAAGPTPAPRRIPFRPTIDEATYKDLKAKAAQNVALKAPSTGGIKAPLASSSLTNPINFNGVNSNTAGGFYPPDTEGAVGLNHFVEITNDHLDIYQKAPPNTRVNGGGNGVSLNAFFGYSDPSHLFFYDPRVIFDPIDKRWIMSATATRQDVATEMFFFAVSQTSDPTGAYYIYSVNVSIGPTSLWDFPMIGVDRNAIIFTANLFNPSYIDSRMFTVAKSLAYNGPNQTLTVGMITNLVGTLATPIVLDNNPNTYLVSADNNDNKVTIYTLTNSATAPAVTQSTIPVTAYTMSPSAAQPGTTYVLDSADSRFENAGIQIGNSLFQVHSIASGGGSKCRFYEFDTLNKQVIQSGDFGRSSTSYDFNPSITANKNKDVFVTWTATDPSNSVNAEVRFSARLHTDPLNNIPSPGSLLFGSPTFYLRDSSTNVQRWGDYSAVTIDPADPKGLTAWIVNETIIDNTTWGSRIGQIKVPTNNSLPAAYLLLLGSGN